MPRLMRDLSGETYVVNPDTSRGTVFLLLTGYISASSAKYAFRPQSACDA